MTTGQNPEALMRVLLVEDDAQTAASIKMLLINENFICDTTDLGEDGLEVGKLYDYDIIHYPAGFDAARY
jgi:DNA-binding response OmpR family regulator